MPLRRVYDWSPFEWVVWTASLLRPVQTHEVAPPAGLDLPHWLQWHRAFVMRYGPANVEHRNPPPGALTLDDVRGQTWLDPAPTDTCFSVECGNPWCTGACLPGGPLPRRETDGYDLEFGP